MAIVEYLAEKFPDRRLWPVEPQARARARSLCAEMHAGFAALRNAFPMNIEASLPEVGARLLREQPDVRPDLERIDAMWRGQLDEPAARSCSARSAPPTPTSRRSAARIRSYALPLSAASAAYVDRVFALPAMQDWCDAARAEHDFLDVDEPYRRR